MVLRENSVFFPQVTRCCKVNSILPLCIQFLSFFSCLLCSVLIGLFQVLQTCQAPCCLSAFCAGSSFCLDCSSSFSTSSPAIIYAHPQRVAYQPQSYYHLQISSLHPVLFLLVLLKSYNYMSVFCVHLPFRPCPL